MNHLGAEAEFVDLFLIVLVSDTQYIAVEPNIDGNGSGRLSKIQISLSKGFLRVAVADLAILAIDFLALVAVSFSGKSIQTAVEVYFPTVLLLEAALCFIVGGLPPLLSTSFSRIRSYFSGSGRVSSIGMHDENERTALFVILLGVFLLLESLVASLLFL